MELFLKQLAKKRADLSHLEKKVLDYLLLHPDKVQTMNLNDLANETFVSTATVSRTCKELGYHGFADLKFSLTKYKEQKPQRKTTEVFKLTDHVKYMENAMKATFARIDEQTILEIAGKIAKSPQIEFFGVGASFPTCLEAARKMFFAGINAHAYEDYDKLYYLAENLQENGVAILISVTGETSRMIEYADLLKRNGSFVIAIVGRTASTLESLVDITLPISLEDYYVQEVDMSARFVVSMILDLIILACMDGK